MNIFKYLSYRKYLADSLRSDHSVGSKKRLADAAGCQASYFSLVLKGETHLTPEQAERLTRFWSLRPDEADYFICLVSFERAGTPDLKAYYKSKMAGLRETHENLGKRIKESEPFPEPEAAVYYSSWQYLAIHILISIPEFQTVPAIASRLEVSEASVSRVLNYLSRLGAAEHTAGRWKSKNRQFHLPRDSNFISLHHGNWRRRAIDNSFVGRTEDLHYTAVSSLSKGDVGTLRELMLGFIDQSRKIVGPSSEEELICLGIDLFVV